MTKITAEQKLITLNEVLVAIEQGEITTNRQVVADEIEQIKHYLSEIETLDAWEKAQKELANAQSYSFATPSGNRTVQKVEADQMMRMIAQIRFRVNQLDPDNSSRSKIRMSYATFNSFYN